ncbi:hypothetical protein KL918_001590 [Ogataea parapolymorpha]|nr:hypothetical protein KL918_001590 [Ogataea parapolymorpha]KAG7874028.1 hypothetical protein KL916_001802 [Ogataea parapolymorpha]
MPSNGPSAMTSKWRSNHSSSGVCHGAHGRISPRNNLDAKLQPCKCAASTETGTESCVLMRTSWVPCSGIAIITPPSGERGFSSQMFVAEVSDSTACPIASPQPFDHTTCPSIAPICSLDNSCATGWTHIADSHTIVIARVSASCAIWSYFLGI